MEFTYNTTPNRTTKRSPFDVDLGYIPNEPKITTENQTNARHFATVDFVKHQKAVMLQVKDILEENAADMETRNNDKRTEITFKKGDYVLLHRDTYFIGGRYSKVQLIYLGPFQIVKGINKSMMGKLNIRHLLDFELTFT